MSKNILLIGLTGGIASGKSAASKIFSELQIHVIDTDIIAKELVSPDSYAIKKIIESFGDKVILPNGTLNRKNLRKIIFQDKRKQKILENILHPLIENETNKRIRNAIGPYTIVVVPLLYNSPIRDKIHRILVIDCNEEMQLQRLINRDDEKLEQAKRIIASQADRKSLLSIADDIILNDKDFDSLENSIYKLHVSYLELAKNN